MKTACFASNHSQLLTIRSKITTTIILIEKKCINIAELLERVANKMLHMPFCGTFINNNGV